MHGQVTHAKVRIRWMFVTCFLLCWRFCFLFLSTPFPGVFRVWPQLCPLLAAVAQWELQVCMMMRPKSQRRILMHSPKWGLMNKELGQKQVSKEKRKIPKLHLLKSQLANSWLKLLWMPATASPSVLVNLKRIAVCWLIWRTAQWLWKAWPQVSTIMQAPQRRQTLHRLRPTKTDPMGLAECG